jgi:methionine biosynthesis protein MetW
MGGSEIDVSPLIVRSGRQFAENDRPDLEALVPSDARIVLDVGCATGHLGAALKRRGVERVVGIELNPEAAREAEAVLDEVVCGNVDADELPWPDESFDCVVYGDVLEHLVDPWQVLRAQYRLVKPGGCVLVSIPNVGYWRVVVGLLRGRFEYTPDGSLDATHLRFFTRASVEELCRQAGLELVEVETSLDRGKSARLNRLTRGRLEHLLVWRYVVVARRPL